MLLFTYLSFFIIIIRVTIIRLFLLLLLLFDILEWPKFVHENIKGWQDVNSDVLRRYTGPLYVLTYENLQKDLKGELGRVFKFLNMTVNATVLDCAVVNQEGDDHRAKKSVQFKELFTAEMIRNITIATDKVSDVSESRFGRRLNYSMPDN